MSTDDLAFRPDDLLEHRTWVRALARSLVRDASLADDLEQDTWLRALGTPSAAPRSPRAWLATVMRNRLRDVRKGDARRTAREERAPVPDAHASPAEVAARADLHRHLIACVLDLEPLYREPILLRYFEGLETVDVGARLGIPASTVRTRLQRGLAQLRERLDRENGADGRTWVAVLAPLLPAESAGRAARKAPTAGLVGGASMLVWIAIPVLAFLGCHLAAPGAENEGNGRDEAGASASVGSGQPERPRPVASRNRGRPIRDPHPAAVVEPGPPEPAGPGMLPLGDDGTDHAVAAPSAPASLVVEVTRADGLPARGIPVELLSVDGTRPFGPQRRLAAAGTGEDGRADLGRPDGPHGRVFAVDGDTAAVSGILDLALRPAVRLELESALRLRVLVQGPDGEVVAGARLSLDITGEGARGIALSGAADDNGRATFRPLPAAVFDRGATLQVEAPGYVAAYHGVTRRQIASGALEIDLERGFAVRGRCVDGQGRPLAGIRVSCIYADRPVRSGPGGEFELTGIDRAEVDVRFETDVLAPRSVRADADSAPGGALGEVVLVPGKPLRVRVVAESGQPAGGVKVRVLSAQIGRDVRRGITGDDGRVTFAHLGEGLHDVLVSTEGEGADWAAGLEGAARDITVGDDEIRVVLGTAQSVRLAFAGEDGEPMTIDTLFLRWNLADDPSRGHLYSIGGGKAMRSVRFRPAAPGRYRLTVVVEGMQPVPFDDVEIAADRETRLRVELVAEE